MVMPQRKLMKMMILDGNDLGSSQEPWDIHEPQMMSMEGPGKKELGLMSCSVPKK